MPVQSDDYQSDAKVDEIVRRGPSGAFAVAAIYFGFYFLVYLPRGVVQ